jgi:hypothetical protein
MQQISQLGLTRKTKQVRKEEKILRSHHSFQEFTISCAMAMAYLDDQPNLEVVMPKTNCNCSVGMDSLTNSPCIGYFKKDG